VDGLVLLDLMETGMLPVVAVVDMMDVEEEHMALVDMVVVEVVEPQVVTEPIILVVEEVDPEQDFLLRLV
jgi:hypothetical protein